MAFLKFDGVGITALAAAVPHTVIDNLKYTEYFPEDQVREVVEKVGIYQRRFADDKTCSSDLCFAAAEKLIADNNIDKSEIDLLIFISQTPTTACQLPRYCCRTALACQIRLLRSISTSVARPLSTASLWHSL